MLKSFGLMLIFLEAIVLLYNRQVAAMLSMHPSCSGRSSTIENKLKMSGGGNGFKQLNPGSVSFPTACLNNSKNLKAKNTNAYRISEASPLTTEQEFKIVKQNDLNYLENKETKEVDVGNKELTKYEEYMNELELKNKKLKGINGQIKQKTPIVERETDPMFYNKSGKLAKKIKQYYEIAKLKNEFNDRGIITRVIRKEYTVDVPKDDQINLLNVSHLLMALNEKERDSTENLENAANLLIGLHECYQILTVIPIVFDVEMVFRKIEKEGEKNKFNFIEYFREGEIKIPLWNLLKIEKSKDSVDIQVNKLLNIIHKTDHFLEKNKNKFIEQGNKEFFEKISSRIEIADLVLYRVNYILNFVDNFKDDNLSKNYKMLKRLSAVEKHDFLQNSELLQKLFENILPEDKMMKFYKK